MMTAEEKAAQAGWDALMPTLHASSIVGPMRSEFAPTYAMVFWVPVPALGVSFATAVVPIGE